MKVYVVDYVCACNDELSRYHTIVGSNRSEIESRIIEDFINEYNKYHTMIYKDIECCLEDGADPEEHYVGTNLSLVQPDVNKNEFVVYDINDSDIDNGGSIYKIYEYEI